MLPLPRNPRLRCSFSFNDGELTVELTLMSADRELVHRCAAFKTKNTLTLAAHRHLLGLAAADGVRAGVFELPASAATPAPAEPAALERAPTRPELSTEDRAAARAEALARPPAAEPEPPALEPEKIELAAVVVTTEEREAARDAARERFEEAGPLTPRDGPLKVE